MYCWFRIRIRYVYYSKLLSSSPDDQTTNFETMYLSKFSRIIWPSRPHNTGLECLFVFAWKQSHFELLIMYHLWIKKNIIFRINLKMSYITRMKVFGYLQSGIVGRVRWKTQKAPVREPPCNKQEEIHLSSLDQLFMYLISHSEWTLKVN